MIKLVHIGVVVLTLFVFTSVAHAQGSAATEIDLNVNELLILQVNHSNISVQMNQKNHYLYGNTSGVKLSHLEVYATSGYLINVSTTNNFFLNNGVTSTLQVNNVNLMFSAGNVNASLVNFTQNVNLNQNSTQVISSNSNEFIQTFNVEYQIKPSKSINFLNLPTGNYQTTVIYTIVPQ